MRRNYEYKSKPTHNFELISITYCYEVSQVQCVCVRSWWANLFHDLVRVCAVKRGVRRDNVQYSVLSFRLLHVENEETDGMMMNRA